MTSKLIVQIVTWNSDKFLKDCLDSLLSQDYRNFSILIIDNGSQDKTREILKKDYVLMRGMIVGEPPDFDVILSQLEALEREINALGEPLMRALF